MFREALGYPLRGDDGPTAVLLGGGVLFAAGLFLPFGLLFFPLFGVSFAFWLGLRGYYVRVLGRSAGGRSDPPDIDDIGGILGDGLGGVLVTVAYALPAMALVGAAAATGILAAAGGPGSAGSLLRGVTGVIVLLVLLYLLALAYVLPAAVTLFAYHDSVGAAFRVRTVLEGAFSEDYAVAWVFALLLRLVGYPAALLSSVLLVGPFVWVYVEIAARRLHGRAFGAALGLDPSPAPRSGAPPRADSRTAPAATGARRETTRSAHDSRGDDADRSAPDSDDPMAAERRRDRDT